ncbi:hypothetical protein THICB2_770024 [Thiomonas sp. CB2]|nr:hypothetical protein THICB2_770024 [Thiomonas sp. CB2]VDY06743.1 protein of unknown function [Thiomonas sp. Bio17B3]VDY09963.1 protein of unknown function [Thiomonas sp. Sup16B3]VDY15016.1 conserved protein of unknown function [Thiomonas sp. OC7]VDY15807.1 protein of unknown function [Thiomonas sp. CB2]
MRIRRAVLNDQSGTPTSAPFLARSLRSLQVLRASPCGAAGAASLGSCSGTCPCNSKCPYGAPA